MTEPMNAEAVAQIVADREAGTPGPWYYDAEDDKIKALADDYAICWDATSSDARRIARLPDLEAAYLALAADNATLRAEQAMLKFDVDKLLTQIEEHNAAWDELRDSEAAAVARVEVLTDFIAEFAEYKFDVLRSNGHVSPEDETDDYTDLGPILAWQEDAASILTPTTDKEPKT